MAVNLPNIKTVFKIVFIVLLGYILWGIHEKV